MVGVVTWGVEDGDADETAGVDYVLCISIVFSLNLPSFFSSGMSVLRHGGKRRYNKKFWGLKIYRWMDIPLGCHMSAKNFIDGGASG